MISNRDHLNFPLEFALWNDEWKEEVDGFIIIKHENLTNRCIFKTFTFSHLEDAFIQSDAQGREQSSAIKRTYSALLLIPQMHVPYKCGTI